MDLSKTGVQNFLVLELDDLKGELFPPGYCVGYFDGYIHTKIQEISIYYDPFNMNDKTKEVYNGNIYLT